MRISKAAIKHWQESLLNGNIPQELLRCLGDILCDLEDFAKRELDEQHVWNCMVCGKTYIHKHNCCTCKHGDSVEE